MLEQLILLLAVLASTAAAYYLFRRRGKSQAKSFRQAASEVMECLGIFIVFLGVNVCLGLGAILLVRSVTQIFVSLYVMDDVTLIVLSALQGFIFRLWWRST